MNKLPSIEDYEIAIDTAQLIKATELAGGQPQKFNDNLIKYAGGFCVVFPFEASSKRYAVRCWLVNIGNAKERTRLIAEELQRLNLPYFVGFNYVENGLETSEGTQPIVLMDWVEASPLKEYISRHINNSAKIERLAINFMTMAADLHNAGISHGDLQHGNIMVTDDGQLKLVDYDSVYVPSLKGYDDEIKGQRGYQHPARWQTKKATPKADYFSELIIYASLITLSRIPQLWYDLNIEDSDTMLFTEDDIKSGGTTPIFAILDSDSRLKCYSTAIKNALKRNDINDLLPLEEAIVSTEKRIADSIKEKWNTNVYIAPPINYEKGTDEIQAQWKDNGYKEVIPNYNDEAEKIKKKW